MRKKAFILSLLCLLTIDYTTAQSYKIQSFDGLAAIVKLFYKPSSGMLTISCPGDTMLVNNYMTLDTVILLNKVFLQINYVKRAGSNEDTMNQLLIYVSNGKLFQALHVNSLTTYDMRPSEYLLFKLRATIIGRDADTYKVNLNIHDERNSKRNTILNHQYNKMAVLAFDKSNKVFYSTHEHIVGVYTFHKLMNNGDFRSAKGNLKEDVPVIQIETNKYYYINDNWYTKDKNDFYSMLM